MKSKLFVIWVENTHSNLAEIPFTGNRHKTKKEANTELAMLFDNKTLELLQEAGLVFTIGTLDNPNT